MNSEQSHRLAVGSSVERYMINETINVRNPKSFLGVNNLSLNMPEGDRNSSTPTIPMTGSENPIKSRGGAIQSVNTPKPLSTGSSAMAINPIVNEIMAAIKK
jgi:hypothetical protein